MSTLILAISWDTLKDSSKQTLPCSYFFYSSLLPIEMNTNHAAWISQSCTDWDEWTLLPPLPLPECTWPQSMFPGPTWISLGNVWLLGYSPSSFLVLLWCQVHSTFIFIVILDNFPRSLSFSRMSAPGGQELNLSDSLLYLQKYLKMPTCQTHSHREEKHLGQGSEGVCTELQPGLQPEPSHSVADSLLPGAVLLTWINLPFSYKPGLRSKPLELSERSQISYKFPCKTLECATNPRADS